MSAVLTATDYATCLLCVLGCVAVYVLAVAYALWLKRQP